MLLTTTNGPCYCRHLHHAFMDSTPHPLRARSAPASPISSSKLAFTSGAVGTASALGYVFARPLQAKETIPCTPQTCEHVRQQQPCTSSPSRHHHLPYTQVCHVHKRFRLFRQKNKCPVHGSARPNYIMVPSTVSPLVVHPDKILPDPPTPPPRSTSLSTFRLSAPLSPTSSSSRTNTPIPLASGALPLPGRLFTKHSNRTEHSFLGLSSSISSSRLSSLSTCSSASSYSTSATTITPTSTPSSSFAQGSDIESYMHEHHRSSGKKHPNSNKSQHGNNSQVHHPAPIHSHATPPLLLRCSCDRHPDRSPSPAMNTRQGAGGAASPHAPPIVSSAHSRLRRIWRDSNLFHWPRPTSSSPSAAQSKPTQEASSRVASHDVEGGAGGAGAATGSGSLHPPPSPLSRRATPYATASLPATSSKLVAASSPSGRAPASSSPSFAQHHLRRPYPAHTYDRNASPYVSDEGNHSISEHEEEDDEDYDDYDEGNGVRFPLGRPARHRISFQGDDGVVEEEEETTRLVLRSFPEGERLESELDRCHPEPPSPLPSASSSRKVMVEDVEDEEEDDEDWDVQSDAGAPSSSPMYTVGAAQPASYSTVTLPLSGTHNHCHSHHHHHQHHHHFNQHQKGPSNGSMRSRHRCVSLPVEGHQHRHGGASAASGSLGNRGMFRLPSLPSENWDEDFEIEAEDINVPTQVVETQISLQMDIYNIKDFALQIEDLKTLRASLRTASRSLRAKNPNKHQHLSTLFQRDWEQAEVIIDLGEIAQTQTQPSRPCTPTGPGAPKMKRPLARRPSKRRLTHHKSKNNMTNSHTITTTTTATTAAAASAIATPAATVADIPPSPAPLPSPRMSAWKRFSRMATGGSSKSAVTSPTMSVGSPTMSPAATAATATTAEGRNAMGYIGQVGSITAPSPLTSPQPEMESITRELSASSLPKEESGSPSSVSRPVVMVVGHTRRHNYGSTPVDPIDDVDEGEEAAEAEARSRDHLQQQQQQQQQRDEDAEDDDDEEDDDDLIDDGYESFSCYSYSFMDGPITGVVSPIPSDRHMQVLKDILVEGLGQEVAQKFVFKNGEQDHVKFSVEVIPGLLNHLKGLQHRLSEQLLEFQRCDEQQQQPQQQEQLQQQQQQQAAHDHLPSQQEIDRNQRPGRASMGGDDSLRQYQHRRRSMRPPLGLDFGDASVMTLSMASAHSLKETENDSEATIEPVAV
ncbi:hypothetical protein BGZ73_006174 [Actinomortierella ambigua]|nr:hypothetical protein BGZ73_006174 [Actinomortierella ambigua]